MRTKFLFAVMLMTLDLLGQERKHIGDIVPDFPFKNVVNSSKTAFSLSEFKGKLLLLDFWSTGCQSCIEAMPKLAKLKKKFAGQLEVLLITYDDKSASQKFLSKNPHLAELGLPMTQRTPEWIGWFPHRTWPQVVWLGEDRKVKAITEGPQVTEANVEKFLEKGRIDLPVKNDRLEYFDYNAALFETDEDVAVLRTASLTGRMEGLMGIGGLAKLDSNHFRMYAVNAPFELLLSTAWGSRIDLHPHNFGRRVVLDLRDSSYLKKNQFDLLPTFCYESIVDKKLAPKAIDMYECMQQDLDRFFNVRSTLVKKRMNAWVIVARDAKLAVDTMEYRPSLTHRKLSNLSARIFLRNMEAVFRDALPIVYEGPADKKITMMIKNEYKDAGDLKKDLQKAGLDLILKEAEVEILVVTEGN